MKNKRNFKSRRFSYQKKLTFIFTVMTVSVMLILLLQLFGQQEKNDRETLYRTVQVENQKNAQALENVFESIQDLAASLVLNESVYGSLYDLPYIKDSTDYEALTARQGLVKSMLISKLATMREMEDMYLYSVNGMSVHVTRQYSDIVEDNFWEQEWYEQLSEAGDSLLYFDEGEEPLLTICRRVWEIRTAKLVGYLEVNFDFTKELQNILKETSLKEGYGYCLLQGSTPVLTNTPDGMKGNEVFGSVSWDGIVEIEMDKKAYLVTASPIDGTAFTLVSGVDKQVLQDRRRQQLLFYALVMAAGTGGAVGISIFAARGMSKNIHRLNKAMEEAETNPRVQVQIRSRDEIGMLGDSFNRMIRKLQATYENLLETELDLKEAQFMALQAQINPHFLYNTLETIDALSVCERTDDIGKIVQALSECFRYAMEEKKSVPLREELQHVTQYLKIMFIRYENKFAYRIEMDEEAADLQVPKIILQPLAENAIVHSILKQERFGEITIRCACREKEICLEVTDNGAGMDEEALCSLRERLKKNQTRFVLENSGAPEESPKKRGHIGVSNVDRRLRYFFGERYHMEVESIAKEKTVFRICIALTDIPPQTVTGAESQREKENE